MIYFDNAGTTKTDEACKGIIERYNFEEYYNPSAQYGNALSVNRNIKEARRKLLGVLRGEGQLYFTSSGTESDNLALLGCKKPNKSKIIVSESEHPAVLKCAAELKQRGYNIAYAPVDGAGRVIFEAFKNLIDENTSLVSIMHVNNETGGINDIKSLCAYVKSVKPDIIFHSDGVQALGKINVNLRDLNVDLYSVSAHKINAPKGCGALFAKSGINLNPILFGGGQEEGVRASTENTAGIICFSEMVAVAVENLKAVNPQTEEIGRYIRGKLAATGEEAVKFISDENCVPNILCFAMKYVRGEVMLHALEKYAIIVGTGSACSKGSHEGKKWRTQNLDNEYKNGILRLSFGKYNTMKEAEYFTEKFTDEYKLLLKYGKL